MAVVTMKNLLESGVHFGHQTRRWDPRMKKYIFAQRNGIHIIDLQKTIVAIKDAYDVVRQNVLAGKSVLFVGTKKQAQTSVKREAERCDMFYVNNRWLGGMLTNFSTIRKSLQRLKKIEKMEIDGTFEQLTKKEVARLLKEKGRLEKNLGGIKNMNDLPGVMFVIDPREEAIAIAEAQRMGIPIIAVVDTNCNPDGINYPIPGNDDAIRAINLFTQVIANAVIEADNEQGLKVIETLQDEDEEIAEEKIAVAEEGVVDSEAPPTQARIETEEMGVPDTPEIEAVEAPKLEKEQKIEEKKDAEVVVTPQEVKKLRDKTGAGMLDCKNALMKADGDSAAAEKILKEQGLASADRRVGRATNNGSVFTSIVNGKAAMVELTCETDFVAKNEVFRSAGEKIAAAVAAKGNAEKDDAMETMVKEAIAVLKENMLLGKIVCWDVAENELVVNYAHNGGIIGVLVKLTCDSAATAGKDEVRALAFDLALHAAAYNPTYLNRDAVDPAHLKEQEDIFTTQANNMGDKPEKVIKGIVQGKLNKHLAQICFVDQGFVKEDKKPVKQIIEDAAKATGGSVELVDYAYIAVGQDD